MARERSPARDKARRVWLESGGTMTARQVAESVGTTAAQVRKWKSADKWQAVLEAQKPPRKRGGQPGNKNAAGAGAPAGNRNAETHGAYTTVRLDDLQPEQMNGSDYDRNIAQLKREEKALREVKQDGTGTEKPEIPGTEQGEQ